jgi:cell division transport system permease protein
MQLLNNTWNHIRRSPYQSTAAVLTLFLTILLTGLFFLATLGSSLVLNFFESKPQITVFFADTATPQDAESLKKILTDTGKVSSMKYISKDDALAIYREQNKSDPLLLEMVTADILPASLEVSASDPNYLHELDPIIQKAQGIEEVIFQKDVVDTLLRWTNAIRIIGGTLIVFLSMNSVLIVMTIIGMKIALKKEEIEILKLIGASPWYIRMPFILEGGLYGVTGSVLSWLIITVLLIWMAPSIVGFLGTIPLIQTVFGTLVSWIFAGTIAGLLISLSIVGFLLGSIGSLVALNRYIKF